MTVLAVENSLGEVLDSPVRFLGPGAERFLLSVGITKHTGMLLVSGAVICVLLLFYSRSLTQAAERVPRGLAAAVEVLVLFVRDEMIRPVMGKEGDRYLPFLATLFLLILACNLLGMIPGLATATGNTGINAGLAAAAFFAWHFWGIRRHGLGGYLRTLVPPVPIFVWPVMLCVEILSHLVRPFALTIRLFANMLAGHAVLFTVLGFTKAFTSENLLIGGAVSLGSVVGAVFVSFLEIFVAFLQAFIFVFLASVFTGMAVQPEH